MKTTFGFALLLSLCVAYAASYPSTDDTDTDGAEALYDFEAFLGAFIQQELQEEEPGDCTYAKACVYCMKLGCYFYLGRDFFPLYSSLSCK